MPPVRTNMAPIKPTKTERSHEENQERAYIAASRRSDRSLEARVESARRASEIHKKRTGRALRVTEKDVLNEEMYEEEDDDHLPWMYRRHGLLPAGDMPLSQKVQAMLAVQLEHQRILSQAVANNNAWQQSNGQQMQSPGSFVNPGMMQMPQGPYQSSMAQQQMMNRTPSSNYRQSPYPMQNNQQQMMRPTPHQRSASIATPQEYSAHQHPYSPSGQATPVDVSRNDDRRMSLPQRSQTSQVYPSQRSPNGALPSPSQSGSTERASTSQHGKTSPQQQFHPSPSSTTGGFDHSMMSHNMNNPIAPLTPTLPMETQQMLTCMPLPGPEDYSQSADMFQKPSYYMNMQKQQHQPFYSYNPNMKPKGDASDKHSVGLEGLNQTLLAKPLDTNMGSMQKAASFVDTPVSMDDLDSMPSDQGLGFGYDNMFNMNLFSHSSGGDVTPMENDWMNSFVDTDSYGEQQTYA